MADYKFASSSLILPASIAVPDDATSPLSSRTYTEASHPYRSVFVRDIGRILTSMSTPRPGLTPMTDGAATYWQVQPMHGSN